LGAAVTTCSPEGWSLIPTLDQWHALNLFSSLRAQWRWQTLIA
jgi:hypothetical protein